MQSALARPENHSKFDDHKIAARPTLAHQVEEFRVSGLGFRVLGFWGFGV